MESAHTFRPEPRRPDWAAGAVAGLAAGGILMIVDLLWSLATTGAGPWTTSHSIAAIVLGPDTLQSDDFSLEVVSVALAAHYLLGIAFGLVFATVSGPLRLDATLQSATLTGLVFGVLLYFVNFYGMVAAFPWFREMRGWATLAAHALFGISAAILYWTLERRGERAERSVDKRAT
jgi:hypothetical protein